MRDPGVQFRAPACDDVGSPRTPPRVSSSLALNPAGHMHELSVAMSLIDVACEEAARLGGVRVEALQVRVGRLSGVVRDALAFSFEIAAKDTAIEGARLDIEEVPVGVYCERCQAERTIADELPLACPVCGEPTPRVVRGRELQLVAMEVTEHAAADRRGAEGHPEEE